MRVLVAGGGGQVGSRVVEHLPGHDVFALSRRELDITSRDTVEQVVAEVAPHAIVNVAAMTDVDGCERDPDGALLANTLGPWWLAIAAARIGADVVHVSTDYVFDGEQHRPYDEWDEVHPLSEYGRTKLGGEREVVAHAPSWAVVRTAWVFGRRGTDLLSWAFGAYERGELDGVFADQWSVPTYAPDLAHLLARFAVGRTEGLFHVTSGSEATTRHELVTTALRARGLDADAVAPITQVAADRPARRPAYSVLDNRALRLSGLPALRSWRDAIAEYVKDWELPEVGTWSEIAVVGAGYVGIPTAVCFAKLGHHVVCADVDEDRIRLLRKGEAPILEEGLEGLLAEGLASGRLRFVVGAATAVRGAEFVFLCVPTPQGESGAADLSYVRDAAREIAPHLRPRAVVVNKSTMPVGSTDVVARELRAAGAPAEVHVASNPEFLRQGHAIADTLAPHRVVVGCDDTEVAVRVSELYRGVGAPILVTDPASAEVVKYASNAFLAAKISFVNSIANLCEAVNADMREVVLGMGYDPRIGFEMLHPGPGYGGSCFPKDVAALLHIADTHDYDFEMLRSVVAVNDAQRDRVVAKVRAAAGGSVEGRTIGAWGLTFKANTDDVRDSPALHVLEALGAEGARLLAYDPAAAADVTGGIAGAERVDDPYDAARGAEVIVLLTEWDEFKSLDFRRVRAAMAEPGAVVDARNSLDAAALRNLGFVYTGIGR